MALLEALTLGIGASVAKATIKLWLGDSTLVSVSANSVVDVLKKYIEDFSARRTTERGKRSADPIFRAAGACAWRAAEWLTLPGW